MELPLYARVAATSGRPVVLLAALAMSAPGEHRLAVMAGWSPSVALLMPLVLSAYAAVAAVMAATCPDSRSARIGAGMALALALTAQVTAHLLTAGYLTVGPLLVAAVSAIPPLVAGHLMHLATVGRGSATRPSESRSAGQVTEGTAKPESEPQTAGQTASPWPEMTERAPITPPSPEVIRAAITALSADGRRVTGQMLADHFGVSERTGRRYLSMAEVNA